MRIAERGVSWDGFRTNVLPVTIATGIIHIGTMFGKLKGVIPATTPTGKRVSSSSMPLATWSRFWPIISVGAPQAKSITSMARLTSPFDSSSVLPFSWVTMAESSSTCLSKSALKRNMTCARSGTGVSLQAGKAFLAAATASSISSLVECGRLAIVWPVAGFGIGSTFWARESRNLPPIKLWTFLVAIMISLLPGLAQRSEPCGMVSAAETGPRPLSPETFRP